MLEQEEARHEILQRARLTVQTALWVSMMDNKGGRDSEAAERKALIETIRGLLREKDYRPLYPMLEMAIENNKAWGQWAKELADLTRDLKAASETMPLLEKQCIYDLAYTVAVQFRERNLISALIAGFIVSFKNFFVPMDERLLIGDYMNISNLEKSALNELADIFNLPRKIIR